MQNQPLQEPAEAPVSAEDLQPSSSQAAPAPPLGFPASFVKILKDNRQAISFSLAVFFVLMLIISCVRSGRILGTPPTLNTLDLAAHENEIVTLDINMVLSVYADRKDSNDNLLGTAYVATHWGEEDDPVFLGIYIPASDIAAFEAWVEAWLMAADIDDVAPFTVTGVLVPMGPNEANFFNRALALFADYAFVGERYVLLHSYADSNFTTIKATKARLISLPFYVACTALATYVAFAPAKKRTAAQDAPVETPAEALADALPQDQDAPPDVPDTGETKGADNTPDDPPAP